ncbi:MAG TPA: FAD-dependent oxidoreductase [Rhodothermales bacterium]|nr:FAD-dependent oxidoreductase [Rhodothermales bacterium]
MVLPLLRRSVIPFLSLLLLLGFRNAPQAQPLTYDVVVYGATSSGVIAAYTARRYGKTVLLIEPGRHLGGMTSGGLGQTDIGNKYAITGLARDFYRRVGQVYGKPEAWTFEPHVAEQVFESYLDEAGVEVLYSRRITGVRKEGTRIESITLEYAGAAPKPPDLVIQGKEFIDTSYEGDLMAKAGVSYTVGREANSVYHETLNGVQMFTHHQFPDGIDPYVVPGDPSSGLLPEITAVGIAPIGSGDKHVQAYNFRMCLCKMDGKGVPIPRPARYDSSRYELLLRSMAARPPKNLGDQLVNIGYMPGGKTDWNNNGPLSSDYIGNSWEYPEASYNRRAEIWQDHIDYQMGFYYFLAHEERVPEHIREEMQSWGLCRDEFLDTQGWPHQLYVREARRMVGAYVMTEHNSTGEEVVPDGVGMAAYAMDSHNTDRLVVDGQVKNAGDVQVGGWAADDRQGKVKVNPYPIAYRALTPKRTEATNLLVPVALSASHIAYGSIRMEPVFMVLGQSAAVAASLAIDRQVAVQQIDVPALQAELVRNPLADGSTPEVIVDDADATHVEITAYWKRLDAREVHGAYGPTVLSDEGLGADSVVRFKPDIPESGAYDVWIYWPALGDTTRKLAEAASITVRHAGGSTPFTINMQENPQEWHCLGTFQFDRTQPAYVEFRTDHARGVVLADAVRFTPSTNTSN